MINTWEHIEFLYPHVLWLLLLCAWLAWKNVFRKVLKTETFILPHLSEYRVPQTLKSRLFPYLPLFFWFGIAMMIVALARPRLPLKEEKVKTEGVDIMMVMDLSSSMLAKDFVPNRMEACKQIAIDFVQKRSNDRIGLVIFAGEAYTLCPLTTDHSVLTEMIRQIKIGILEDNTAIGMGLATAVKRLKDVPSQSKIIILLTDGENNAGYIDPLTATELAKTYGIKIYTVAVGTIGIAMVPSTVFGRGRDIPRQVNIDTELLTRIADETNGKFFRATDNESLQNIYNEIDRLEKSEIELNVYKRYAEMYRPFLILALISFILQVLTKQIIFRGIS